MSQEHLISDEETRRIVEIFLTSAPWLGKATWGQIIIGPGAEYRRGWDGDFDPAAQLSEGQRWSWVARFVDPTGQEQQLTHEILLQGMHKLIYETTDGLETGDRLELFAIKQWFTEPVEQRRVLRLSDAHSSLICQTALYGRPVFSTKNPIEEKAVGRIDWFEDQRQPAQPNGD